MAWCTFFLEILDVLMWAISQDAQNHNALSDSVRQRQVYLSQTLCLVDRVIKRKSKFKSLWAREIISARRFFVLKNLNVFDLVEIKLGDLRVDFDLKMDAVALKDAEIKRLVSENIKVLSAFVVDRF